MIENNPRRINPRRAYEILASGVKRIVLGATTDFVAHEVALQHSTNKPLRTPKQAKTHILVVAHSDRGTLDDHAKQCLAAAAILAEANTAVVALILGELHEELSNAGADEVLVIAELDYAKFQPESELSCVKAMVDVLQPSHIFMPDNLIGDGDLGRRLITSHPEKLAATHVIELNVDHIANYQSGGSALALANLPFIVLLAPETADTNLPFSASALTLDQALAHPVKDKVQPSNYIGLGMQTIAAAKIALEEADFIVSAGNGVSNVQTLQTLAAALDAAVGASRVAVDDGKFARDKQIGATGKTVSASTYFAIGISGAVQHLQGIKDCRHVIAINRDHSAAIVKRANLSLIGDAEEIMQALIAVITEAKLATQEAA